MYSLLLVRSKSTLCFALYFLFINFVISASKSFPPRYLSPLEVITSTFLFFTSSFFDFDFDGDKYFSSYFTVTEDGQLYKNKTEVKLKQSPNGEIVRDEIDAGIERMDFTGEIYFGTEFFGKDYDYAITFMVLFYKGDLKELELEKWDKKSNEKRKEAQENLRREFEKINNNKKKYWYQTAFVIKLIISRILDLVGWVFLSIVRILSSLRGWVNK